MLTLVADVLSERHVKPLGRGPWLAAWPARKGGGSKKAEMPRGSGLVGRGLADHRIWFNRIFEITPWFQKWYVCSNCTELNYEHKYVVISFMIWQLLMVQRPENLTLLFVVDIKNSVKVFVKRSLCTNILKLRQTSVGIST